MSEWSVSIDWAGDGLTWLAHVDGHVLKQKPHPGAPETHWLGYIDGELRVEGGGLEANRRHLLAALKPGGEE